MILRALWLCMRVLLYKCYSSFFYTRSLGNGNSKFRLWKQLKKFTKKKKKLRIISTNFDHWKQLKNLQKKNCESFPPRKKMFNNFDHFYFGKKRYCYMYFTKHLLYLAFPNLVCKTWNTDAKFLRPTGQLFF